MLEDVDWGRFDLIGVDHYRDAQIKDRYVEMLQPLLAVGKPVVITEFGVRTYRGAEDEGGTLGFGIADPGRVFLHQLPAVGRLFLRRLKGVYVRDEAMQARELGETLAILEDAGVDGAFVNEFVTAEATTSDEPRYDLDMNAFSLVKTYRRGKGTTCPDMNWEPKQSFSAVADFDAGHHDGPDQHLTPIKVEPTPAYRIGPPSASRKVLGFKRAPASRQPSFGTLVGRVRGSQVLRYRCYAAVLAACHAVGEYPSSVAVGDSNGDGKLEFVTANFMGATVLVLLRK